MKKFNFQCSDLTDNEHVILCNFLIKHKSCYAIKNDVGKFSTPFRIRLKPNVQLMTQRPSNLPIETNSIHFLKNLKGYPKGSRLRKAELLFRRPPHWTVDINLLTFFLEKHNNTNKLVPRRMINPLMVLLI